MTNYDPTLAQRVALRIIADLGGSPTSLEVRDHPDYTTMTHLYRLRDDGYVESRPTVGGVPKPRVQTWELTERGHRALRDELEAWERAHENLESEVAP